jgi:hypothetical protein
MRAFACDVSKLQRHRCPTFGALWPWRRRGQTGSYIFIYIDLLQCTTILVIFILFLFLFILLTHRLSPPPILFSLHLFSVQVSLFVSLLLVHSQPQTFCTAEASLVSKYPTKSHHILEQSMLSSKTLLGESQTKNCLSAFHLQNFSINVNDNIWYTGFTQNTEKFFSPL